MRMLIVHLANGDLLLMYVYVDNNVFRPLRVCMYSNLCWCNFVDMSIHLHVIYDLKSYLRLFDDCILEISDGPC